MAHVLIAATNDRYRRALDEVLSAAGHHSVTTPDAGLARAALSLSNHRMVALLADGDRNDSSMLDVASIGAEMWDAHGDPWHVYILLTRRPRGAFSDAVRGLLATGSATILPPDCSIAALLTAIDAAKLLSERLRQRSIAAPDISLRADLPYPGERLLVMAAPYARAKSLGDQPVICAE
ncbi:MAG TPA: hypothetical protein VFQ32_04355 [Ktedonobacterales bacterium]|nr:hypothetical protein [Ktedonobacterales bacterium]